MKLFLLFVIVATVLCAVATQTSRERAESMLALMRPEEKLDMLHGTVRGKRYIGWVPANERLGIPAIKMNDGPQGFRCEEYPGTTTAWPSGLTVGATWDKGLAQQWGEAMGKEFFEKGANVFLGPGMNVARVPVNGRNFEYVSGGDPYLGKSMVAPIIEGVQGQGIIANAKHWVNNNQETNRQTVNEVVDEKTRYELYYPPFEGAVDAGVGSFMCSYNKINSLWSCENPDTLKGDLKDTLGFQGWVMSDWEATHSVSINAGLDQEMPGKQYFGAKLKEALDKGEVDMAAVDESVLRILTPMYEMGVMDRGIDSGDDDEVKLALDVTSESHNNLAAYLSAKSHVLLKNEREALPLHTETGRNLKIAVIGQMAREPIIGGGGSGAVYPKTVSSPYTGLMEALGMKEKITDFAINCTQSADYNQNWGYEQDSCMGGFRVDSPEDCADMCASYPGCRYFATVQHHCIFTPTAKGKKPMPGGVSGECSKTAPAASWACQKDSASGDDHGACVAVSDGVGSNLEEALRLAQEADVVLIAVGTTSGEGSDRESLGFERTVKRCQLEPEESQDDLIPQIAAAAKKGGQDTKVVVAMASPGAALTPWRDDVDAILHGFMPGQAYGHGLASVLLGNVNPTAKLPMSMPNSENEVGFTVEQYPGVDKVATYSEGQLVDYRWYDANGIAPAYAFGHGLSYSSFQYADLTVTPVKAEGSSSDSNSSPAILKFTATITNTSPVAGSEAAQLYVRFPTATGPGNNLVMRAFTRTGEIQPREQEIIEWTLTERDLSEWNVDTHAYEMVKGKWHFAVGSSVADIRLETDWV